MNLIEKIITPAAQFTLEREMSQKEQLIKRKYQMYKRQTK